MNYPIDNPDQEPRSFGPEDFDDGIRFVDHENDDELGIKFVTEDFDQKYNNGILTIEDKDPNDDFITIHLYDAPVNKDPEWERRCEAAKVKIGALIVKLGEASSESSDTITIGEEDINPQRMTVGKSEVLVTEIQDEELREIPALYRDIKFRSSLFMAETPSQRISSSCTLATAIYALETTGTRDQMREEDIIEIVSRIRNVLDDDIITIWGEPADSILDDLRKKGVTIPSGPIGRQPLDARIARAVLRIKGLEVKPTDSTLELINALAEGDVAIVDWGGHSRLISGVEVNDGRIRFWVNDPLGAEQREVEEYELKDVVKNMARVGNKRMEHFYNTFIVTRPKVITVAD